MLLVNIKKKCYNIIAVLLILIVTVPVKFCHVEIRSTPECSLFPYFWLHLENYLYSVITFFLLMKCFKMSFVDTLTGRLH